MQSQGVSIWPIDDVTRDFHLLIYLFYLFKRTYEKYILICHVWVLFGKQKLHACIQSMNCQLVCMHHVEQEQVQDLWGNIDEELGFWWVCGANLDERINLNWDFTHLIQGRFRVPHTLDLEEGLHTPIHFWRTCFSQRSPYE